MNFPDVSLIDVSTRSIELERTLRAEDAPKGSLVVGETFNLQPGHTLRDRKGVLVTMDYKVDGYAGNAEKTPDKSKPSFHVRLCLQGFFAFGDPNCAHWEGEIPESSAERMFLQIYPLAITKTQDMMFAMGYKGVRVPFTTSHLKTFQKKLRLANKSAAPQLPEPKPANSKKLSAKKTVASANKVK
jgi:hypothetical protein